jgi:hypothetical protein
MPNRRNSKKGIDKAVVIAIIGLIGTILTAIFASPVLIAIIQKTPQPPSTATMAVKVTNTELPTPTVFIPTLTFTPLPQQGFSTNCINATDWTPSPKSSSFSNENNCWDLSSNGIAAQDGKLFFAIQNSTEQRGAIYTPIPREGTISFNVRIDTFVSGQTNGNLAFGVGRADNWLSKGKFVFFRATDSGYYIVYGGEITEVGRNTIDAYNLGSDVVVAYEFKNLVFDIYVNNTKVVSDIPVSSSPQVFWIGYRLLSNSKLVAYVSDFRLEK